MNQDDIQLNIAKLGLEAETFTSSNLGRYLIDKADNLISDNTDKLIECESSDIQGNVKYRNQIHVGALFKQFLHEAILDGQNAHEQINQQESLS